MCCEKMAKCDKQKTLAYKLYQIFKIIYIYVKFSVKNINHWYINIKRGK